MIGLDYLKLSQMGADADVYRADALDERQLARASKAVTLGQMWQARPAMTVFFDGCLFWVASHFHRYESAVRAEAPHCEFWCDISRGTKGDAINHAKGVAA